jgi:hypothetical protein
MMTNPILGVSPLLANPFAADKSVRFIDRDLNRCFSDEEDLTLIEHRLAKKIRKVLSGNHDIVIDVHNTTASKCSFAVVIGNVLDFHVKLANHFGFDKIIAIPSNSTGSIIEQHEEKSIVLEIADLDIESYSVDFLYEKIRELTCLRSIFELEGKLDKPQVFHFEKLISAQELIDIQKVSSVTNFDALNMEQRELLDLYGEDIEFHPIFIGEKSYLDGCWIIKSKN